MDILIKVIGLLGFIGLVSPYAIFEVDLLRYEALPNKCCDGYKKIHFGPLKCNECDPYFNICLKQLPSGASRCVKTSRENNVHSKDLTDGNIQPNHLSLSLQSWKGSLLVDVDVKDYDSTTQDDDIDRLYYTFTGQPEPESKMAVINGTKVRLTIATKLYCAQNYYGENCTVYCEDSTNFFCDSTGTRQCKPGYKGIYCIDDDGFTKSQDITIKDTTNKAPKVNAEHVFSTYRIEGLTGRDQHKAMTTKFMTVINDRETRKATPTLEEDVTTRNQNSYKAMTKDAFSKNTEQVKKTAFVTSDVKNRQTDGTHIMMSMPAQKSSESIHSNGVSSTESLSIKTATSIERTGPTAGEVTSGAETTVSSPLIDSSSIRSISIPEPIELYSCNMVVRGHKEGVHTQVVSVIYNTLSNHPDFNPGYPLGVNTVSSTFETIDNGQDVTDVSYVVYYNGMVLRSESVVRILSQPPVARVLHDRLKKHNIERYYPKDLHEVSSFQNKETWASNHLPFVIVMVCVFSIIIIVPSIYIIKRACTNGTHSKTKKGEKSEMKSVPFSENKAYDMQYSIENPAYDFDNGWPAYKNSYA